MQEHCVELPEDPVTSLNLVARAAEAWGGTWQAGGRQDGQLRLPVLAGLRYGWVAGGLTAEKSDTGSKLTFRVEDSEYRVQGASVVTLGLAAVGAVTTLVAPFFPALWRLVPIGLILSVGAWFFIVTRLRNSGPEEFFEDLAREAADSGEYSQPTARYDQ